MSSVRVLVGTRKGAFVLTSDGKREKWDVSGPHFGGWEIYHLKGSPADPESAVCVAVQRLVRAADPALQRRRQDLGAGGQQVRLRRRPRHAPVVRRHAAPVGVQARLASRAVADRSGHGLRRRGGRRPVPLHRRRHRPGRNCPDCAATARARSWQPGAGGMCLHTILLDPSDPERIYHRHLGRRRVPHRRRRRRRGSRSTRGCAPTSCPTRRPRSATACTASPCTRRGPTCCSCRSTGT